MMDALVLQPINALGVLTGQSTTVLFADDAVCLCLSDSTCEFGYYER